VRLGRHQTVKLIFYQALNRSDETGTYGSLLQTKKAGKKNWHLGRTDRDLKDGVSIRLERKENTL